MSTYDPVEQEEALREWWQRNGTRLLTAIAAALAVILGVQWWLGMQEAKKANAALLYSRMLERLQQAPAEAQSDAGKIMEEFADTPYAGLAALVVARLEVEGGKPDQAQARLRWAQERLADAPGMADLVRLRLARVQMGQGQWDDALSTLNGIASAAYNGLAAALRGDVYLAKGQRDKARTAYRTALADPAVGGQQRALLQMKLDELGGEDAG